MSHAHQEIEKLLALADVQINGDRPWDIQVKNEKLYGRALKQASLGLGESYMDGWWDCAALDILAAKLLRAELDKKIIPWNLVRAYLKAKVTNRQQAHAYEVGEKHYDIGNDLYTRMLDKRLTYSCAYWNNAQTLDEAQEAKLDLICQKLWLQPGMRLLDIGCGWGSLLRFAAERYGVSGVGITVSKEQKKIADERCKDLPIEIRLQDYRAIHESFDRIASVGMFEHVGLKNYRAYMRVIHRSLMSNGLAIIHTIGMNDSRQHSDPWLDKYIFPNYFVPSVVQLSRSFEKLFVLEDWHNLNTNYHKTLLAWYANFDAAWPSLKEKYGERFYRLWRYYLLTVAGSFLSRKFQVWQVVLSKNGSPDGYTSIR